VLAGAGVLVLALPIFLVADWPLAGWVVAAVVWVGVQGLGLLLTRIKPSADNLAASSVLAFGMMGRLLGVLVVLVAVTASNHTVGLAAAVLYGLAYTAELAVSLATYYVQEPRA
jgi:NCAIR mutase (PurE)-related protein